MAHYTVQPGDTPMSIAKRFAGDPDRARDLVIANPQKDWIMVSGLMTFRELKVGEIINFPFLWTANVIGVGRPLVGLGDNPVTIEEILRSSAQGGDFPLEKLTKAAKAEVDRLAGKDETTKRLLSVAETVGGAIVEGGISFQDAVAVTATVATMAAGPIAGAVVMGIGMGLEALKPMLGDILPFLGGSSRIPAYAVDISMDCMVVKNLRTGKKTPGRNAPYGFDSPGWWHIVDRNSLRPGFESWDPRGLGIPGYGPWVNTGSNYIYGSSGVNTIKCNITNTTMECFPPNYQYFQYNNPGQALLWMFGVVFNELWAINESLTKANPAPIWRNELQFRKFFYGLLLRNWEARINCSANINDRLLLSGAVNIWNAAHTAENTIKYTPIYPPPQADYFAGAASGYCFYEFNINGSVPERLMARDGCECPSNGNRCDWSITDISWSKSKTFIEFILSGTFDPLQQKEMAPIVLNLGSNAGSNVGTAQVAQNLNRFRTASNFKPLDQDLKQNSIVPTSTAAKIVKGAAVTTAVAAGSVLAYSFVTKQTFIGASKHLFIKAKSGVGSVLNKGKGVFKKGTRFFSREENPIGLLPPKPSDSTAIVPYSQQIVVSGKSGNTNNKNRRVAYRVDLGGDPYVETVRMLNDGSAVVYRQTRPISRFMPTPYQYAKIRAGQGSLLIYRDQLLG